MRKALVAASLLTAWTAAPMASVPSEPPPKGVVVISVAEDAVLYAAGVRPGDRLVGWNLPASSAAAGLRQGELRSPFDWEWVQVELAPRGTVELRGWRGSELLDFAVAPGTWSGQVRPSLPAAGLEELEAALGLVAAGEVDAGLRRSLAVASGDPDVRCWLRWRIGEELARSGRLQEALTSYRAALEDARDAAARGFLLDAVAAVERRRGDLGAAEAAYAESLGLRRRSWGEDSLSVARSRADLGDLAWNRGDVEHAAEHHRRALAIRRQLAPGSLTVADSLKSLGSVAGLAGDLEAATDYVSQALAVEEELAPDGLGVAYCLNQLGILATMAGRLADAEEHLRRSLAIRQRLAPGSLGVAANLINLGKIAWRRGTLDAARSHYRSALVIQEKLAPGSLNLAALSSNLGWLARDLGDAEAAESYHRRALAIREQQQPGTLFVADSLVALGRMAIDRGQLTVAAEHTRRALEIQERAAPGSLLVAESLAALGEIASQQGQLALAERHHQEASGIRRVLAPGSRMEAESLYDLGRLRRRTDRRGAAELFEQAIASLDSQVGSLGGSEEVRSRFRAGFRPLYRDTIDLLLELGRPEEAFRVLESSRARSFLTMLAEKDPSCAADLPTDLEAARGTLVARYDQALARLCRVSPREKQRFGVLSAQLDALRRERDRLVADIRRASGRCAELRYPQPLDFAAARGALDPGTVMLSYDVGPRATNVFAVMQGKDLRVERVEIAGEELEEKIRLFRRLIEEAGPRTGIQAVRRSQLESLGRQLYGDLVQPVADWLAASDRVLLVPDGPLHVLPFRALRPAPGGTGPGPGAGVRYLVEWKPLHTALSATVFGEIRKLRRLDGDPSAGLLTAFGDPEPVPPVARSGGAAATGWPLTHEEVERIAALYPPAGVRSYLSAAATEERAKQVGRETRVLHFATHATLDDDFPLDSALVLAGSEEPDGSGENGLLQAFEILEELRLDADLVVLSGCETGLGQELAGEGLIGLTRAFQYAGARSVAASLWRVSDEATVELMVRFHRHLRDGASKDEALRAAQIELIRGVAEETGGNRHQPPIDASAPLVWAAFELYGDWR